MDAIERNKHGDEFSSSKKRALNERDNNDDRMHDLKKPCIMSKKRNELYDLLKECQQMIKNFILNVLIIDNIVEDVEILEDALQDTYLYNRKNIQSILHMIHDKATRIVEDIQSIRSYGVERYYMHIVFGDLYSMIDAMQSRMQYSIFPDALRNFYDDLYKILATIDTIADIVNSASQDTSDEIDVLKSPDEVRKILAEEKRKKADSEANSVMGASNKVIDYTAKDSAQALSGVVIQQEEDEFLRLLREEDKDEIMNYDVQDSDSSSSEVVASQEMPKKSFAISQEVKQTIVLLTSLSAAQKSAQEEARLQEKGQMQDKSFTSFQHNLLYLSKCARLRREEREKRREEEKKHVREREKASQKAARAHAKKLAEKQMQKLTEQENQESDILVDEKALKDIENKLLEAKKQYVKMGQKLHEEDQVCKKRLEKVLAEKWPSCVGTSKLITETRDALGMSKRARYRFQNNTKTSDSRTLSVDSDQKLQNSNKKDKKALEDVADVRIRTFLHRIYFPIEVENCEQKLLASLYTLFYDLNVHIEIRKKYDRCISVLSHMFSNICESMDKAKNGKTDFEACICNLLQAYTILGGANNTILMSGDNDLVRYYDVEDIIDKKKHPLIESSTSLRILKQQCGDNTYIPIDVGYIRYTTLVKMIDRMVNVINYFKNITLPSLEKKVFPQFLLTWMQSLINHAVYICNIRYYAEDNVSKIRNFFNDETIISDNLMEELQSVQQIVQDNKYCIRALEQEKKKFFEYCHMEVKSKLIVVPHTSAISFKMPANYAAKMPKIEIEMIADQNMVILIEKEKRVQKNIEKQDYKTQEKSEDAPSSSVPSSTVNSQDVKPYQKVSLVQQMVDSENSILVDNDNPVENTLMRLSERSADELSAKGDVCHNPQSSLFLSEQQQEDAVSDDNAEALLVSGKSQQK